MQETHKTGPLAPRCKQSADETVWRCTRCDKLLGVCRDGRMHLRFARAHEYFTGLPVEAICRACSTLNRFAGLPGLAAPRQ